MSQQVHQAYFDAAMKGVMAGILAGAGMTIYRTAPILVLITAQALLLSRLRGWPELTATLSMVGTMISFHIILVALTADSAGIVATAATSGAAICLLWLYVTLTILWTAGWFSHVRRDHDEATLIGTQRTDSRERWEESNFARMRTRHTAGKRLGVLYVRPIALVAACFFALGLTGDRRVEALVYAVMLVQLLIIRRLYGYEQRLHQAQAAALLARDTRAPILFLRAFTQDERPVGRIDHTWKIANPLSLLDHRTFEERVVKAFQDLGPVIAIGRPNETTAPLGAAREYVHDDTWREHVVARARESALTLIEIDSTPGLEWELAEVTHAVGLQRVLMLLPPGDLIFGQRAADWEHHWDALRHRFEFLPDINEDTVAIVFGRNDEPFLVDVVGPLPKRLAAVRRAWERHGALGTTE